MSVFRRLGALVRVSVHRNYWWAVCALVAGLIGSGALFRLEMKRQEAKMAADFDSAFESVTQAIQERIQAHRQILRSGAAMVMAKHADVTREQWRVFADRQKLKQILPGIEGFGFAVVVPRERLAEHTQAIRAEGFPDYHIRPEGDRPLYSSIIYLEPFTGRNLRAFGYDMLSEPVRHEAMQRACDQDEAILSGPVTLVQETGVDPQVGTLMYVPVYRRGKTIDTVEARRAALVGWVYSPYRMNDLIQEILDRAQAAKEIPMQLHIYDGDAVDPARLLFVRHHEPADGATDRRTYDRDRTIDAAGRTWRLCFSVDITDLELSYQKSAWYALGGGILLSALLSGLMFSVFNTQYHARIKAERLTADLMESEARWKFAIEGSGIGVFDWDLEADAVVYSRRWKEILGYADHEIGQGFEEWRSRVHPDDLPFTAAAVQDHLEGRTDVFRYEYRMRAKDGSWKWFLSTGKIVHRDADGRPLRVVGTNADITPAKQQEENLALMLERERQVSEMKTRFVSVTSHEFRTPLAAAMASLELLLNHADRISAQKRVEMQERINRSLHRMNEILDEMLVMNRIEEGRLEPRPGPLELRELMESTMEEVHLAERETHRFDLQAPASLHLMSDPAFLRHIVANLLSNAARYAPHRPDVAVRVEVEGDWVTLTIQDQGIGIPAADLQRVFEPFERGSNVGQIKGTGLGLNIVKRMTEMLGGTVTVTSQEGAGSCFTVRLPFHPVAPSTPT